MVCLDASIDTTTEKRKAERVRVPSTINIELRPKTNTAWHRVSDMSHNPHLRLKVKAEQSLSTVIEAIERKWVPSTVRYVSLLLLATFLSII